jgi:polysaccharide biosynthesis transport protein
MDQLPLSPHNLRHPSEGDLSRDAGYSRGTAGYPGRPGYAPAYAYADQLQPDEGAGAETGGLIEYWRMLRRRRGTLVLIAALGIVVAVLVTLPQTPVYRARTALEVQNINSDFLNAKQINPLSEDGGVNPLTDVQTQMKIVLSENLIDSVIAKYSAADKLGPLRGQTGQLADWLGVLNIKLPAPKPGDAEYKIQQKAIKNLTVRQLGQTRVLEVLFDSPDPAFAAGFLNDLTAGFIDSNMEARWQMSQHTGEWLSRQLDDMRIKLERSQDALETYARQSGLLYTMPANPASGTEKTNVSEEKLRQLQEELSKAQADRAGAQSRYEVASSAAPDTLADVLSDVSLRELQGKLTELRRQEAELLALYTPKHEKVRAVLAQIAPLESAFNKQRSAILNRIRTDYDTAMQRERLLQADYSAQARVVTEQAGKSVQYNILRREVDSNQQLYESLLQQVKEASVASAMRASNIRIVDRASLPHKPYSPDYILNCGLGLLSGLLAGVALVVMQERADHTLREPGDAQFWTNLPELGVIPTASAEASKRVYYARRKALPPGEDSAGSEIALALGCRTIPRSMVELMSWNNKPSMLAEAFRAVLTSIMFSGENGARPRLLVLTSGSPREGKTTVVSNLAIALAEVRQRVLVIDADLRKPRMHELFDLCNDRGLSTLLSEEGPLNGSLSSALEGMVQETSIPNLHVLPSGPSTYAAANLLYSPVLGELLAHFKKDFDMVLIDTPPMLSMSDARVAGRLADAVIFVARAGQTTRDAVLAAHQRFAEDRIPVLGTILNDWDPRRAPNGYYGYHQGSYYSGKKYSGYYK